MSQPSARIRGASPEGQAWLIAVASSGPRPPGTLSRGATGCRLVATTATRSPLARRLKAMGNPRYQADGDGASSGPGFGLTLHHDLIDLPRRWRKPRVVFVNSMSDLFHPDVPLDFVQAAFEVMRDTPQHTYQILTKRSQRLRALADQLEWPPNVWMGVSVETARYAFRMDQLRDVPAAVRFVSAEPLLEPLPALNLTGIHWLIAGGESGPPRPADAA